MPIINGIEYIDNPEANSELISGIINLPISGRRKLNPTDTKKKRITRKDVAKMARDMANSEDAQQYLSGQVSLGGNKSRQKLFDRAFKSEIERQKQEELLRQIGLGGEEVVVAPGIKGDDAYKIATSFRDRPLTGHIGAGLDQNLGDKDLLRIAPATIGPVLGMANPVTGAIMDGMLSEAVNLGSKATPYIDKMVTPVKDWFLKDGLKWYDPRHIARTIINPKSAYTAGGQAAATALDLGGAYSSYNDLVNNVWTPLKQQYQNQGYIDVTTLPSYAGRAGMDFLGMTPILSYADDVVKIPGAVYSGLSRLADDTVQSYNALRSGVEPVYGIRAEILGSSNSYPESITGWQNQQAGNRLNEQLRNRNINIDDISEIHLPEPPSATRELPVGSGTNAASLPISLTRRLHSLGIGRYDIQGLLDRGFTPEQLLHIRNSSTPGVRTNERANILAQQLIDSGINPERISRRSILNDAANSGTQIVTDNYGYPMTIHEAQSRGIQYRPSTMEWVDTYYGYSPTKHPIYDDGSAQPIFDALDNAIGVFNKNDLKQVLPEIQKVIESGYDSQKSLDDILVDLQTLFESHNKPFLSEQLETIYAASGNTNAEPTRVHNSFKKLLKSTDNYKSNPDIALNPYNSKTVSFVADKNSLGHGYNQFYLFETKPEDIRDWEKAIGDNSLHGSYTTESSKSLQSSSIAHHKYADRAKNGEGVIVYLTENGRPVYDRTNGLEQSTVNPALVINSEGTPEVVQVPLHSLLRGNINHWRRMLQQTDPRALAPFDGKYPSITANFGGKKYPISFEADEIGNIIAKYDPRMMDDAKQFDAQNIARRQSLIDQYLPELQNYDGTVLSDGSTIKIINNLPVVETKQGLKLIDNSIPGDWYWNLSADDADIVDKIGSIIFKQYAKGSPTPYIYQPQAGFRMFDRGGKIINNLNPTTKQLLNI